MYAARRDKWQASQRMAPLRGIALGCMVITASATIAGQPPALLFQPNLPLSWVLYALTALASLACLIFQRWPANIANTFIILCYWMIVLVVGTIDAVSHVFHVILLVEPVECLILCVAFFQLLSPKGRTDTSNCLIYIDGMGVTYFGLVHIFNATKIAFLIPGWLGSSPLLVYATGTVQLICGVAILCRKFHFTAASVVGVMFASWVVVIHVPRLMTDPHNAFEWQFAGMAICLSCAQWLVVTLARPFPAGNLEMQPVDEPLPAA